jgi:hypothetical protein
MAQVARRFATAEEQMTWDPPLPVPFIKGERQLTDLDLEELEARFERTSTGGRIAFNNSVEHRTERGRVEYDPGTWIDLNPGAIIRFDDGDAIEFRPE